MKRVCFAETAETIGMAQRGGKALSVMSGSARISDSPLIPYGKSGCYNWFEAGRGCEMPALSKEWRDGCCGSKAVLPVTASLGMGSYSGSEDMLGYLDNKTENLIVVDTDDFAKRLGSAKVRNMS